MNGGTLAAAFAAMLGAVACLDPPASLGVDASPAAEDCVHSLAASTLTSCSLYADGTVHCFGWDEYGELGNDLETQNRTNPVLVADLDEVRELRGGSYGFCAVRNDGNPWCWGKNELGRLGDRTEETRATPVRVEGITDVREIELGARHACALREDGSVWCWGSDELGRLGDGLTEDSLVPVQAAIPAATTLVSTYGGSCAVLDEDQGVACWGNLGTVVSAPTPEVYPISGVVALSGHSHSIYALLDDRTLMAWGVNEFGQLGIGSTEDQPAPVLVSSLSGVIGVAGGGDHACAVLEDGSVWCWGRNRYGQIALPGVPDSSDPVRVDVPPAKAIASGQEHTCILAEDGTVHCWGNNCCGQLGDTPTQATSPPLTAGIECAASE